MINVPSVQTFTEQFFWESNIRLFSQKIPAFYGTQILTILFTKARHLTILSYMNSAHTLTPILSKIHFNIIFPSTPRFPSGLFLSEFTIVIHIYFSSFHALYTPSYLILLVLNILII
jgi:hypothetical protein